MADVYSAGDGCAALAWENQLDLSGSVKPFSSETCQVLAQQAPALDPGVLALLAVGLFLLGVTRWYCNSAGYSSRRLPRE